jgi:hypothetical protein
MVLKATKVGNNFLLLAHINVRLVNSVKKYNHQICMPKTNPGTIIIALQNQLANSTIL